MVTFGFKTFIKKPFFIKGKTLFSIELSFDFNNYFTYCCVSQHHKQLGKLSFINEFYIKSKNLGMLIYNFLSSYNSHANKFIYIYGDRNGYNKDENNKSKYDKIKQYIYEKNQGWKVSVNAIKGNIYHSDKFEKINDILLENDKKFPKIRINKYKCPALLISIRLTETIKDFKKDKSSERKIKTLDPEQSTHASDAFDYRVYPLIFNNNNKIMSM